MLSPSILFFNQQQVKKHYGGTCNLIGLKIEAVVDIGADVGGGIRKERGQDSEELSNGGVEEVDDDEDEIGTDVNVGGWKVDTSMIVDEEHHEFLAPFFVFWVGSFKLPDLLAALMAAWLLGIWLGAILLLEVEEEQR